METLSIIVKGSRAVATREGTKYTTVLHVSGLVQTNPFNLILQGLQDPISKIRIPIVGELSLDVPGSIILAVDASPSPPDSRTQAKVVVTIGPPELGNNPNIIIIDIEGSSGQKIQQFDADGNQMILKYNADPNVTLTKAGPEQKDDGTVYDTVSVPRPSPNTVFSFTKTLNFCPGALNRMFRARTNKDPWNGYPSECVLCRAINGKSIQGGVQYRTTFLLEAAPPLKDGSKFGPWDVISYFKNAIDGQIPNKVIQSVQDGSNPMDGTEGAWLVSFPTADFTQLNLPAIST